MSLGAKAWVVDDFDEVRLGPFETCSAWAQAVFLMDADAGGPRVAGHLGAGCAEGGLGIDGALWVGGGRVRGGTVAVIAA